MLLALGTTSQSRAESPPIEISDGAFATALSQVTDSGKRHGATNSRVRIFPTIQARQTLPASVLNRNNFHDFDLNEYKLMNPAELKKAAIAPAPGLFAAAGNWSPADLAFGGGAVLPTTTHHPIYVNCKTGTVYDDHCWVTTKGDIPTFIKALNQSTMITIANQYVGSSATNRYPLGKLFGKKFTGNPAPWNSNQKVMLDSDAQAIALAAANTGGSGYTHMYHIFVPPGMDSCFDPSYSVCYSPDHSSSFAYCGYHSSFDSGGKHIVYSVEPFDAGSNGGCQLSGMSTTDAQVSVLSHEIFEAITDPDPNSGWNDMIPSLGEIGDACAWHIYDVNLNTHHYNIQLEYSNKSHACTAKP
jgi:hypothetical protein